MPRSLENNYFSQLSTEILFKIYAFLSFSELEKCIKPVGN